MTLSIGGHHGDVLPQVRFLSAGPPARPAARASKANLRRSADELRAHLAKAEEALRELGEYTLDA